MCHCTPAIRTPCCGKDSCHEAAQASGVLALDAVGNCRWCGRPVVTSAADLGGGKYGSKDPRLKLHKDEPYFFLRAQDRLAPSAVEAYAALLEVVSQAMHGTALESQFSQSADDVRAFALRMRQWQIANADKVKLPD